MKTADEKRSEQKKFCLHTNKKHIRLTFEPVDDDEFYYELYLYGYRRQPEYIGRIEYDTLTEMATEAEFALCDWIIDEGLDLDIKIIKA